MWIFKLSDFGQGSFYKEDNKPIKTAPKMLQVHEEKTYISGARTRIYMEGGS